MDHDYRCASGRARTADQRPRLRAAVRATLARTQRLPVYAPRHHVAIAIRIRVKEVFRSADGDGDSCAGLWRSAGLLAATERFAGAAPARAPKRLLRDLPQG